MNTTITTSVWPGWKLYLCDLEGLYLCELTCAEYNDFRRWWFAWPGHEYTELRTRVLAARAGGPPVDREVYAALNEHQSRAMDAIDAWYRALPRIKAQAAKSDE